MNQTQESKCKTCGKPTVDTGSSVVHVGGGIMEQRCRNCGWVGGQVGKFVQCPRCGDETQLDDDHSAN
ncbi:MAG: hypothetical protein WD898_02365 [Candidatus Paceibacterota bacterium]